MIDLQKPDNIGPMNKKRLLVYGDVEMDILLKTDSIDPNIRDAKVEDLSFSPGGSAANCAAIAGSLGLPVTFLGSVGSDVWSTPLLADLRKHHVNTEYLKRAAGNTGTCVALVDGLGERKFYSYRGVNESAPLEIPSSMFIKQHYCLHLSGYSFQEPNSRSTASGLLHEAKKQGLVISLDPSFLFARDLGAKGSDLLAQLDLFFPNREEAALISGKNDPAVAAKVLRVMGIKTVVITLGEEGCLLLSDVNDEYIRMEPPARVVDTTGAGDAFCGGFLTGMLNGFSAVNSAKLGSATAAYIITRMGARENAPGMSELLSIIRQNHELELAALIEQKYPV
jgi:sugar/nucleoside kinase (ribokinase family)